MTFTYSRNRPKIQIFFFVSQIGKMTSFWDTGEMKGGKFLHSAPPAGYEAVRCPCGVWLRCGAVHSCCPRTPPEYTAIPIIRTQLIPRSPPRAGRTPLNGRQHQPLGSGRAQCKSPASIPALQLRASWCFSKPTSPPHKIGIVTSVSHRIVLKIK